MKKKIFYLLIFLCCKVNAQVNLVINPSFEDVNELIGPCSLGLFNQAVNNWRLPTWGSSDVLHMSFEETCVFYPLSTSLSPLAYQLPRTGDSMVGFGLYSGVENYREYIEGELSSPLQINKTYEIKFYLSLGEISNYGVKNIGVKFYESQQNIETNRNIQEEVDVEYTGEIITDKENWVEVKMSFTPSVNNLKYFIIGNFKDDDNTLLENLDDEFPLEISYYVIDDVSINLASLQFNQLGPYCQGADFVLPNTSLDGISGTWSPALNNQKTTTYTFTPDDSEYGSVEMIVEILPLIKAEFNIFEDICYGDDVFTLPTISNNGISGTWDKPFNNKQTDYYTFTPFNDFCSETTELKINVMPDVTVDLITFCKNNEMYAEVKQNPNDLNKNFTYQWFINDINLNINSNIINLNAYKYLIPNSVKLEVIITQENLCKKNLIIESFNLINCEIPKGISANNDGLNDRLDLSGMNIERIKIFNRYGKIVYERKNYLNEWFGQSNQGNILPSGTYYYSIQFKYSEEVTGWIQLINEVK